MGQFDLDQSMNSQVNAHPGMSDTLGNDIMTEDIDEVNFTANFF